MPIATFISTLMNRELQSFVRRPLHAPVAAAPVVSPRKKIRVLVVDDSQFMQRRLTAIVAGTTDMEVVGCAANGLDAIHLSERLAPDVITMDINMSKMDGLEAISHIMRTHPRPIVVISSYTRHGGKSAMYALELGVVEIVEKPSTDGVALDIANLSDEILRAVRTASRVKVVRSFAKAPVVATPTIPSAKTIAPITGAFVNETDVRVVAIGASTGGPVVLRELLAAVPRSFAQPILIVQHMPPRFTRDLANQLSAVCPLNVCEAEDGMDLRPGRVLIAPGGVHMEVDGRGRVRLFDAPPVCHCKPAVDVLFDSLAKYFGPRVLAFVLTGMGEDGAAGARRLKAVGATIVAQDEESSVVFGMPKAVIDAGAATSIMSSSEIGGLLRTSAFLRPLTSSMISTI